jgi:hypothetical protein
LSALLFISMQALAAVAGVVWNLPQARAKRRLFAALQHYGERELAKSTHLWMGKPEEGH